LLSDIKAHQRDVVSFRRREEEEKEDDGDEEKFLYEPSDSAEERSSFRANKNTPLSFDALARTGLLATRFQLQNREVYENQPIFVATVESFNNYAINSGGLQYQHAWFTDKGINPE
jgi:hypothetical protein